MKFFLVTGKLPSNNQDSLIEIGQTNPFDSSGKPFEPTFHEMFGIQTLEQWKRLIHLYGDVIQHEYFVTPEGLRWEEHGEIVPTQHLFSLLNDGFFKGPIIGNKIIYFKQKGRIEDETGKTYTVEEMFRILEDVQ